MLKPTCQAEGCGRKIPQTEKHNEDYGNYCEQCNNSIVRRMREKRAMRNELTKNYFR